MSLVSASLKKINEKPTSIYLRRVKLEAGVLKSRALPYPNVGKLTVINPLASPLKSQSGVVLVVSLIMLLLLTLIGLSGMQATGLEEKMAGNMRDRNLAFQAAEAALRDAENDAAKKSPRLITGAQDFTVDCGASTAVTTDDGLCYAPPPAGYPTPVWEVTNMAAAPSVAYGDITGAAVFFVDNNGDGVNDLSAQPRYIIEALNQGGECQTSVANLYCYRITVRAQGANPNTVVWLQTIIKP